MKCTGHPADECCWICLQDGDLIQPCKCPRPVHKQCLASWQLHAAGTREETQCRFCSAVLPDWKPVLSGRADPMSVLPVVAVVYNGTEYRLAVQPTSDGLSRFTRQVEVITGVPFNNELEVKFFCRSPTGYNIQLKGTGSLDAAMHCAAVTAAERQQQQNSRKHLPAGEMSDPPQSSCAQAGWPDVDVDGAALVIEPDPQDYDIMRYWRATVQAEQAELRRNIAAANGSSSCGDSSSRSSEASTGSSTSSNSSRAELTDAMNGSSTSFRNRWSSASSSSRYGSVNGSRALTTHSSASIPDKAVLQPGQKTSWTKTISRRPSLSVNLVLDVQPPEPIAGFGIAIASCLPFGLSSLLGSIWSWILQ